MSERDPELVKVEEAVAEAGGEDLIGLAWADQVSTGSDDLEGLATEVGRLVASTSLSELPAGGGASLERALALGDLEGCADLLAREGSPAPGHAALWAAAGDLALALEAPDRARAFFERAEATSDGPRLEARALRGQAEAARRQGARRRVGRLLARALDLEGGLRVPVAEEVKEASSAGLPHPSASRAAEIGLAHLEARAAQPAREWLERALALDPGHRAAARALVGLLAEDGQRGALERLVQRTDPGSGAAQWAWLMALGYAWRVLGEHEAATRHYLAASEADPEALEPAEALVALAAERDDDELLDRALSFVRRRAAGAGARDLEFNAAAIRLARGSADWADRAVYARERGGRGLKTRLPPGWLSQWLGFLPVTAEVVLSPQPLGAPRALPATAARALEQVVRCFGAPTPPVHRSADASFSVTVGSAGPALSVPDPLPRLGALRFELGRCAAALLDPRLLPGLGDAAPEALEARALDRAGLLAAGDPMAALERVGPRTARGRALTAFAVSSTWWALARASDLGRSGTLPNGAGRA